MDLLDRINALTDDQLRMVAERDDASGVLASYRLSELRGLPYPDRSVVVLGDEYAIIARDGSIERVAIEQEMTKIIRQEGDNYCVYSEDGERSFGCYPSMEEAQERLRQIHYFDITKQIIREGSFVRIPDGRVGRVWHIMRDGVAEIPDGPTLTASEDNPAFLVVIYEQTDDRWQETEAVSGGRLEDLEHIEPLEKAKVSVGDHVLYAVPKPPGPTTYAHGNVDRIETSGTVTLPGTDESVEATSEDPVAVITVWADTESGYTETDRRVARPVSSLRVSGEPLEKVSDKVMDTLRQKADEHNEKVGDAKSKRTTARTLAAVFERGVGAYRGNPGSVRPSVTSAEQWAYGRVNGFLYALENGRFKRSPFDTDLLPEGHPLSTKSATVKESFSPPQGVQEAAQRALDWISEGHAGSGFTDVGRARAAQLARGDNVSRETIGRMASYFARHEVDSKAEGWNRGEDGFPSAGRVAWDAWGGDPGRRWAESIVARDEKQACPPATQDIGINLANRQQAIDVAMYGPLNPGEPSEDYWERLAGVWDVEPDEARKSLCGNCAAFDITTSMKDCIAEGVGDEADPYDVIDAGELGYCRAFKFKCAAARTCSAWISGGPIDDDSAEPVENARPLSKAAFLKRAEEKRFTLGPLYVPDFMDAHGEWTDAEELQAGVWHWVRSGDRRIFLQHDTDVEAGEWVEVMTMPQPWTVDMIDSSGEPIGQVTYPPNTVFLGVVWNEDAWQLVRDGQLRGYSIGGYSDRMYAELPDNSQREGIELDAEK